MSLHVTSILPSREAQASMARQSAGIACASTARQAR
jgi:hypothetical protein